mgnify:CR=1 FL=1
MVADVDVAKNRIVNILFGEERPVSFSLDSRQSSDGNLSDSIIQKGLKVLTQYRQIIDNFFSESSGTKSSVVTNPHVAAVATEVFRKAPNGLDYLRQVCVCVFTMMM